MKRFFDIFDILGEEIRLEDNYHEARHSEDHETALALNQIIYEEEYKQFRSAPDKTQKQISMAILESLSDDALEIQELMTDKLSQTNCNQINNQEEKQ